VRWPGLLRVTFVLLLCVAAVLAAKNCPSCGASNRDDAKFCKGCGYEFPRPAPSRPALPRLSVSVVTGPGTVEVRSTPDGARVTIDGGRAGVTPFSGSGLSAGQHELLVERDGYRDYSTTFTVARVVGTALVTVAPAGAEVLLDGKSAGTAGPDGLRIEGLSMGSHLVQARFPGYEDASTTLRLTIDEPNVEARLELAGLFGMLLVQSRPSGASLLIDGRPVAETPYSASLAPARYSLVASKPGFEDWAGVADVRSTDTTSVAIVLSRLKTRKPALLWLGLTTLAGTGASVALGEMSYSHYLDATTPADAERLRKTTQTWDMARNVAGGVTALLLGSYLLF